MRALAVAVVDDMPPAMVPGATLTIQLMDVQ